MREERAARLRVACRAPIPEATMESWATGCIVEDGWSSRFSGGLEEDLLLARSSDWTELRRFDSGSDGRHEAGSPSLLILEVACIPLLG